MSSDPKEVAGRVVTRVNRMKLDARGVGNAREFAEIRDAIKELATAVSALADTVKTLEKKIPQQSITGLHTPK